MPISSAGVGSGLDVNSIVSSLMAIERQPLERLQQKQSQLQAQISAYGQLKSDLSTFQEAMDKLSTVSALKVFTTSSSNENVVSLTATSTADLGNFGIEVVRIAEQQKMSSAEKLNTDTFGGAAGDSLSIQVGADALNTITVDLSTASTLSNIRDAINNDVNNPGVTATIVNGDAGNQKLILTADNTGSDSALTLSYGGAINAATFDLQTLNNIAGDINLLNAEINVDGYNITRSSNNIDDVISGVTINLISANPGVVNGVAVERDLTSVEESVQGFADAYNTLRSVISDQRGGQLEADSTLLAIERQIRSVINNPATGGTFSVLSEIGLSIQKDGTMTLNSGDLTAALQADFDGVSALFAADGQGFANRFSAVASNLLDVDGLINARTDGLQNRVDTNVNRQDSIIRNLELVEARFMAQFTALDALVAQLQSTGQFLTNQLASLPGSSGG